jgi:double-stranded uracil-DNA glycosylase
MATKHVLPDRLKPGLKLVFFGLTPNLLQPHDYEKLWELGIGLTDIAKYAYGMDHQLPRDALGPKAIAALEARIRRVKPAILAFTSLNGGRKVMGANAVAGEQPQRMGDTRVFILPSPAPLAANHWDIKPWRALARAVEKL